MKLREFTLMEGDLLPALDFHATDGEGNPLDLTGGTAAFWMATLPIAIDENSVNAIPLTAATIVDPVAGHIRYQWVSGDTDARGKYRAVFEVTIGARKFSLPNDDAIYVTILARGPIA
jgi:hypothetical protein